MSLIDEQIAEAEALLAKRREERAAEAKIQYLADLDARNDLEEEHGPLKAIKVSRFVAGSPTMALLRCPKKNEYARFVSQLGKGHERKSTEAQRTAQETLALSVWVYPASKDDQATMLDAHPGLLSSMCVEAAKLAEGVTEEEGKG